MRNLKLIVGMCLMIAATGCAYYDGNAYPNGYSGRPAYYGSAYRAHHSGYAPDGYAYRPYRYRDYGS